MQRLSEMWCKLLLLLLLVVCLGYVCVGCLPRTPPAAS